LQKRIFINNQIRADKVRLIGPDGKQLGIFNLKEALEKAREAGLDLVQVTDKVTPPVCKIMDYGKYLYQQKKKERKMRRVQSGELKNIRLTFNISEHDMETRAGMAEKFLKEGDKVRIELVLRGREKALSDFAKQKVNKFLEILKKSTPIKIERELKKEARGLTMIITRGVVNE
jgi:translation initiation factor IF-3